MTDEIAQQIVLASRPSVPVGLDRLRSGPGMDRAFEGRRHLRPNAYTTRLPPS
jgi:hypothetical protein